MKKSGKKNLIALIMVIVSIVSLITLQAGAVSNNTIGETTYTYEGITAEKAEQVVQAIFGDSDEIKMQPFNILCIFGHSKQTGMVVTTEHSYYSTAPKCKETISYVDVCTRSGCDYFVITSQYVSRTSCH